MIEGCGGGCVRGQGEAGGSRVSDRRRDSSARIRLTDYLTFAPAHSPAHPPQSLAAVPFGSIVIVLLIWMFISFPLCLFGTVVGRNWGGTPDNPCRCARADSLQPALLRPLPSHRGGR